MTALLLGLCLPLSVVFGVAGANHFRNPKDLEESLRRQDLLPAASTRLVSRLLGPAETISVAILVASVGLNAWRVTAAASAWLALLGFVFTAYLMVLSSRGYAGSCGCGVNEDDTVSIGTTARAAVLAFAALTASIVAWRSSLEMTGEVLALGLAAGLPVLISLSAVSIGWSASTAAEQRLIDDHAFRGRMNQR